ncbi:phosphopantetheine-binding protein [Oceanimonas doudoroffii]|uniref:Acyl carrier protein n=1 Tax=Oceanimonas doudoroffii TaxID=84158 RepID=A0A233RCA0_9GAMM|nr:phosphopantetheine-binding protein [Oceanimonas doudoroffii]OXY81027.1 acyl carrier protein [Oceanimonas doudoroffii]
MSSLQLEVKQMIIEALDLEDIEAEEIDDDDALFVDGLGLDSIDALEIGLALQKRYGIKLKADSEDTKKHFASVNALAALIQTQTGQ